MSFFGRFSPSEYTNAMLAVFGKISEKDSVRTIVGGWEKKLHTQRLAPRGEVRSATR